MADNTFSLLLATISAKIPIIIICIISLIALIKSKKIPFVTMKIAVFGFVCLLINAGITIAIQIASNIYTVASESSVTFGLKLLASSFTMVTLLNLTLNTLGLALIARAIFSGREIKKGESRGHV